MKDIKCSSEAREKCPFDLRCVSEEEAYFEEGSACDAFNKKLNPPPPITNADHIRSMTDEELAAFLMELMFKTPCFGEGVFPYHPCPQDQDCKKCGVDWLKQPYKEET